MKAPRIGLALVLFVLPLSLPAAEPSPRQHALWDFQWQFHRGDAPGAEQPGQAADQASGWRTVDVPHDWSIERVPDSPSLFDKSCPAGSGGGFLPGGIGWYRKTFAAPPEWRGRRVAVEFEGVYMDSDVWLNGQHLGNHPYGYTPFQYDLTPYLRWDGPNVLAVRAKVEQPCSRWYSGAGIYRHVWLTVTAPVHVAPWGTYVSTPQVSGDKAEVHVQTVIANQSGQPARPIVRTTIVDGAGHVARIVEAWRTEPVVTESSYAQSLTVTAPHRWSLADPYLYTVVTQVLVGGKVVDEYRTPLGIRTIEFTQDRGFLLNGQSVPLRGVCDHHDQGYLGAAANDRAIQRQLEILKSMGCNAIRTSHNPPAPKLLDLCDRMGIVVMDEAFDEWKHPKTKFGYGRFFDDWADRDLRTMLHRDRNHPCVVLWSIGNEIPKQGDKVDGPKLAHRLADICHQEDPTRPVTSACNMPDAALKTGFADALDVFGINYHVAEYEKWKGPKPLIASETSSSVSSRGEYNLVLNDGRVAIEPQLNTQVNSYDTFRPPWADLAELQLKRMKECPWMTGEFVWTGFDYIGEPTPFPWPAATSYFGIVDLCGFPKDRYYLYQSQWTQQPMVHILPHWNWPGLEGREIPVWCYTNAETVELFLDGQSLGQKRVGDDPIEKFVIDQHRDKNKKLHQTVVETGWLHVAWRVPYRPGTLKAVARRKGQTVASDEVATAGPPARVMLVADRPAIAADGQDLAYVTVRLLDAQGRLCPQAGNLIRFDVQGPGTLAAVGNGDATCHEDFQAHQHTACHGLCLAIIKAGHASGAIHLTAAADGLHGVALDIQAQN